MSYDAVIVDAMIVAYSHWWPCRHFSVVRNGEMKHTGLEFGFMKAMLAYTRDWQPAQVYLAWDGVPVRGLSIDPGYKAGRDHSLQDGEAPWGPRLDHLRETIAPMLPSFYHPELEADEIIALFVKQQEAQNKRTLIISNDGDMFQLVSDLTQIKPSDKEQDIIGRPGVIDYFGVVPEKVPFYRAIAGDRSDKLGGIPRIDNDVKIRLANEANNLEQLIQSFYQAPYLTSKAREKLIAGVDRVRKNFQIGHLRDLQGELPSIESWQCDPTKAKQLCVELEFNSLLARKEWVLFEPKKNDEAIGNFTEDGVF